jgi:hypothetical protein
VNKPSKKRIIYIVISISVIIILIASLLIHGFRNAEPDDTTNGLIGFTGYNLSLDFFASLEQGNPLPG